MARLNWEQLRKEYIVGKYKSLSDFADKKGLKVNGNFKKQTKGWSDEKVLKENQKSTKIIEKTIEKVSEKEADRNARHIALLDLILDKTEKVISEELNIHIDMFGNSHEGDVIKVDKLQAAAVILEKAQKGHRLALGLDKFIDQERLEIERKKLAILENKDKPPDKPSVQPYIDALKGVMGEVWDDEAGE